VWYNAPPAINGTATDTQILSAIKTNLSYYSGIDGTSPFNFTNTSALPQGTITVNVSANDSAGNMGFATQTFSFDNILPSDIQYQLPTSADNANISQAYFIVNISFTEANPDACTLNVNGANYTMERQGQYCNRTMSGQSEGTYTYRVFVNDSANNLNASATRTVRLDTTAPAITIISPTNTTYQTTSIDFNITISETASWSAYSLDGAANATLVNSTGKW